MYIEGRLALGTQMITTIILVNAATLIDHLRTAGYGVISVNGQGANGSVKLIYTIVPRRSLEGVLAVIHQTHPHAFLTIQDVRSTQEGIFPLSSSAQTILFSPRKFI